MSLVPLLYSNWWEDLDRPHSLLDQDFGLGLHPEQLLTPALLERYFTPRTNRNSMLNYRPWAELLRQCGKSTIHADKDKFQVILDVQQFKPEEINVKVVDKCVVVEAKHEEKRDEHGWISRQFTRKYQIPDGCDVDQVASSLSSDGVLTITAPRNDTPKVEGEKVIPIDYTGKPAVCCNAPACKESKECQKTCEKTCQKK